MTIRSVGVVGIGTMGGPIAGHLLTGGYRVTIYDIRRALVEELSQRGAQPARSAKEVAADSDLTLVIVVDDAQVKEVCLGPGGVLEGAQSGAIVAICSTVQPTTCRGGAVPAGAWAGPGP